MDYSNMYSSSPWWVCVFECVCVLVFVCVWGVYVCVCVCVDTFDMFTVYLQVVRESLPESSSSTPLLSQIALNTFYTPAIQASSKENNLGEESNLDVYFGRFIDVHAETSKLALILDVTWTSIFGPILEKYVFYLLQYMLQTTRIIPLYSTLYLDYNYISAKIDDQFTYSH